MGVFDVQNLQAQDDALDQAINEIQDYIVSALKEFPAAARQMNTPACIPKIFIEDCKMKEPEHHKACYILATKISTVTGRRCPELLIGANGQGFGFIQPKIDKSLTAEGMARFMVREVMEIRDLDSAKQLFESALRGMPMDITLDD